MNTVDSKPCHCPLQNPERIWLRFFLPGLMILASVLASQAVIFPPAATEPKNALSFAPSRYVEVSTPADFEQMSALTLEAWVNVTTFNNSEHVIIGKGDAWSLLVKASTTQRRLVFRTFNGTANDDLVITNDLTAGIWYHVAAVFNGSQKLLYIDGTNSVPVSNYAFPLQPAATVPVTFGAQLKNATVISPFTGLLDTVRIWSAGRTSAEILADIDRDLQGNDPRLLGEWRFNEPSGLTAYDSSDKKHDGFLRNPWVDANRVNGIKFRPSPVQASVPASALFFEGTGGQFTGVNAPHETAFDVPNALTIETWINCALPAPLPQTIINKGNAWGLTRSADSSGSSTIQFFVRNGQPTATTLISSTALLPGRWYHVAGVFDGNKLQLYIDGTPEPNTVPVAGPLALNDVSVVFGGTKTDTSEPFHGTLESVRIWKTARTATQLNDNIQRDLRGSETDLLGEWRFNEQSGSTALDSSYGGHDATLESMTDPVNRVAGLAFAPPPPPSAEVPAHALFFRGGPAPAQPRVEITEEAAFDLTETITIEAWVNVGAFDKPWQAIVTKGEAWGLTRFGSTSKIAFRTSLGYKASDLPSNTALVPNRWYHIAAVFDGAQKRLYIDGVLDASGPLSGPLFQNDIPVVIGANGGATGRAFNGTIDTVRIWSVPRSEEEIQAQMDRDLRGTETGLLGDWRFDEPSGLVAYDSSKNAFSGQLKDLDGNAADVRVNGLRFRNPANGELALLFSPTGAAPQYVELPSESLFDFPSSFQAEMWVYFEDWPVNTVALVSKGANAWAVNLLPSGKVQFHTFGTRDPANQAAPDLISATTINRRTWQHVAVTWDASSGGKRIYIDGSNDAAVSDMQGSLGQNDRPVLIAAEPDTSTTALADSGFRGVLDEVRLWATARSEDRIRDSYTRRLNGTEPGLLGMWSFDEGTGAITRDGKAGSPLNGTLKGGMTALNRVDGYILGQPAAEQYALSLDGVDDFVQIASQPDLNLANQATIEAWIRPSSLLDSLEIDDSNVAGLVTKLMSSTPALSPFLWSQFSSDHTNLLTVVATTATKKAALLAELNTLIQGPSLYQADRFVGVTLRAETLALTKTVLSGTDVIRLNRLLLEDAYSPQIKRLSDRWQAILSKGTSGYGLALDGDRALRFYCCDPLDSNALPSEEKIPFDTWSQVAVVVDQTARTAKFFVNGHPAGSHDSLTFQSAINNTDPLFLGKRGGGSGAAGAFFKGQLDEVRIWNVARPDLDLDLLSLRQVPYGTPGLVAYWQFNAGSGITASDSSFKGHDGTLTGGAENGWTDGEALDANGAIQVKLQADTSSKGLWIGQVTLSAVNQVHARNNNDSDTLSPTPERAMASFRIILHVDAQGAARLLKDVIIMATTNAPGAPVQPVLITDPQRIPDFQGIVMRAGKKVALRHGAAAIDFPGLELPLAGGVGAGVGCMGKINLPADHPTNPFRHRYHPEHRSGYDLSREISMQFDSKAAVDAEIDGPSYGVSRLTGTYYETVTGLHKLPIKVGGVVVLDRISDVAVLNAKP